MARALSTVCCKLRIRSRLLIHLTGFEYTETLDIGPLCVNNQSIGAALVAQGFDDVDGILGFVFQTSLEYAAENQLHIAFHSIGPTGLTKGWLHSLLYAIHIQGGLQDPCFCPKRLLIP